ncbi:hypothetical protein AXX17_AT4G24820 [Arabidopsis thaliana]|uniref:Uncharacterized protein n=1 Tax=Arabidopsis thaliana TaxID=3702 RepID=A0A178UU96_ARATH|nr:hypothetical protein AXX17_AT4G24820 [Arabidopsis thaliana]
MSGIDGAIQTSCSVTHLWNHGDKQRRRIDSSRELHYFAVISKQRIVKKFLD